MTIQEAIKSGKPFKRPYDLDDEWLVVDSSNIIIYEDDEARNGDPLFCAPDILADDWEVKP